MEIYGIYQILYIKHFEVGNGALDFFVGLS